MANKFENLPRAAIIKIMLDPWPFIEQQIQFHGWSSLTISKMADVSASTVRALVNGQNKRASHDVMQKLLKLCISKYVTKAVPGIEVKVAAKTVRKKVAKKKAAKKKVSKKKVARKSKSAIPGWMK